MSMIEGRQTKWYECVGPSLAVERIILCASGSAVSPMINRPCQKRAGLTLTCVAIFFSLTVFPGLAQNPALDALVRAYPDFLASYDGGSDLEGRDAHVRL